MPGGDKPGRFLVREFSRTLTPGLPPLEPTPKAACEEARMRIAAPFFVSLFEHDKYMR